MEDLLKLKDFANKSYYKTLALDTEFDVKLRMVTDVFQTDASCSNIESNTSFEVLIDDDIICRHKDLQVAIVEYNKVLTNELA